jgi:hypothetical protein
MRRMQLGLALIAGAVVTACCPKPPQPPQPMPGCPANRAPATSSELDACLQGTAFDEEPEVGDAQPLLVLGKGGLPCPGDDTKLCRYGPLARIEPLIGAQNYSERDLREGRIIARLSIPSGEREGYRKFGMQPGLSTYWWVQTDSTGTHGESVFLTRTSDGRLLPVTRPLQREIYDVSRSRYGKGAARERATARWVWTLDDETTQGRCGAGSCK